MDTYYHLQWPEVVALGLFFAMICFLWKTRRAKIVLPPPARRLEAPYKVEQPMWHSSEVTTIEKPATGSGKPAEDLK